MNRRRCFALALLGPAYTFTILVGCSRRTPAVAIAPAMPTVVRAAPEVEKEKQPPAPESQQEVKPDGRFDGDRGTKLVGELLRPSEHAFTTEAQQARGPRPLPGLTALERPQLPLPAFNGELPRFLVNPMNPSLRPDSLVESLHLDRYRDDPRAPLRERLPSAGPVWLPSLDLSAPVPLPILAAPVADRAPLGDPTPKVSLAAVLAQPVPVRTTPAPFVRLNLPDPFEHAQTVRLHSTPEEDLVPPIAAPQTPGK